MQRKMIKRDFRQMNSPARFLAFCMKVLHGLRNNPKLPDSVLPLCQQYFEMVGRLDTAHHLALDGGRSLIRDRETLSAEIMVLLDQIASILEAAFILDPDALLTTGFTVTQERRSTNRVKLPLPAPTDLNVVNSGEKGRAIATASTFPGALIHEIHINLKDPTCEEDWFHKDNFPDSREMEMNGLLAGNTFIRMRHFGQDGAGPWSGIVSILIT
jgi:hypothetical protein